MADEKRGPAAAPDIPDLEVPAPRPVAPVRAAPAPAPTPAFADDDDDPLGMQIERDVSQPFQASPPSATRPRTGLASSGLEVTYRRLDPKREDAPYEPGGVARVLGPLAAILVTGGAVAGLVHVAHRPAGVTLTSLLPHGFDGTSVVASGAVAVTLLAASIAIGFVGVRASSRSWALVGAAGATILLALAMVTVTLASMGEHGPPPDGALLVPFLAPLAIGLGGVDLFVRGMRAFVRREGVRKLAGVPLGAAAGLLLFAAVETSGLAALLP